MFCGCTEERIVHFLPAMRLREIAQRRFMDAGRRGGKLVGMTDEDAEVWGQRSSRNIWPDGLGFYAGKICSILPKITYRTVYRLRTISQDNVTRLGVGWGAKDFCNLESNHLMVPFLLLHYTVNLGDDAMCQPLSGNKM